MTLDFNISTTKNLLAFSGGIDSTALFFLLLEKNIPFDIAIVDYNRRAQSKEEVAYAKLLAKKYDKECFIKSITLEKSNFEAKAREVRYSFFKELIDKHNYQSLITAHQLNDKFEWFLMQLSRGAGLHELLGLQDSVKKENYTLYRPLLHTSKSTLENYLKKANHKYFYDLSNDDLTYKRNYFRAKFSNAFIDEFEAGVEKSLQFLHKDLSSISISKAIYKQAELEIFVNHNDDNINIRLIDSSLKQRGYLLSHLQREEILKQKMCVIDNFAICISQNHIFIAPYYSKISMPKAFKEFCRLLEIPSKIRPYLFEKGIDPNSLNIY